MNNCWVVEEAETEKRWCFTICEFYGQVMHEATFRDTLTTAPKDAPFMSLHERLI